MTDECTTTALDRSPNSAHPLLMPWITVRLALSKLSYDEIGEIPKILSDYWHDEPLPMS